MKGGGDGGDPFTCLVTALGAALMNVLLGIRVEGKISCSGMAGRYPRWPEPSCKQLPSLARTDFTEVNRWKESYLRCD